MAIPGVAIAATHPFDDVPEGQWYSDAVEWAYAEGITTGVGPTTFAGEDTVDRYVYDALQKRQDVVEAVLDVFNQ